MRAEGFDDYVMKGCGVSVCPGTKFCSRLQSFVLRGSAECRWDRGESSEAEVWMFFVPMGERAGLLCIIIKWKAMVETKGNARWF